MFYNCSRIVGDVNLVGGFVHTHSGMGSLVYNAEHELPFERLLAHSTDSSPACIMSASCAWQLTVVQSS